MLKIKNDYNIYISGYSSLIERCKNLYEPLFTFDEYEGRLWCMYKKVQMAMFEM